MYKSLSLIVGVLFLAGCSQPASNDQASEPRSNETVKQSYVGDRIGHWGVGAQATPVQIAGWDIDIRPDGHGLPPGSGSVEDGEFLYEEQCAECHGSFGEGVGRYPVLAGGEGTLTDDRPSKTVGSFWPYTSTLYDYIYRAMPFAQPESLSHDETYALTAYVLYLNDLVEDDFVLTDANLASLRLPNEPNFVPDPRPDVANTRCMDNCRAGAEIVFHSEVAPEVIEETIAEQSLAVAEADVHPGQANYDQYCSICHKVGVGGAPVMGDVEGWKSRIDAGTELLIKNAIEGISTDNGVMPPKGGFVHLSDQEITAAVEFMVEESS